MNHTQVIDDLLSKYSDRHGRVLLKESEVETCTTQKNRGNQG